ncbi:MAG TPA: FtsX-like permease family protein [Tenuifilaceae bacterium]|nr:FtsX-like permease family protein [Tenuifilaceae bacterium]
MLISLSWRNIWRNKTRSMIVVAAIAVGLFGGVMAVGILNGWINQRVHDSIYNEIAHVQIHNPEYLLNEETNLYINNTNEILAVTDTMKDVKGVSARIRLFCMAQSDRATTGMVVMGINPTDEEKVSQIYRKIIAGEYVDTTHQIPSIVIGSKAAEVLKLINYRITTEKIDSLLEQKLPEQIVDSVKLLIDKSYRKKSALLKDIKSILSKSDFQKYADRLASVFSEYRLNKSLVLTIQSSNGELHYQLFKVRGIYQTSNSQFDAANAFVDRSVLAKMAGLKPNQVHQVAIICNDMDKAQSVSNELAKLFPTVSVRSWKQTSPEIALYAQFGDFMGLIYVVIILFALAFGIINTMMMSVLERIKELGMLMAIGMNKVKVFIMIMLESVMLSLTGGVVGMGLSAVILAILGHTGIDFSAWSEGFAALGFSSVVYPSIGIIDYIEITVLVVLTGIISSLWPARRALKLNPIEALREE